MTDNALIALADEMASDFLFLSGREVDIPAAGMFLNQLEGVTKAAEEYQLGPIKTLSAGMSFLLEKMILDAVKDKEAGFAVIEKGITLIQQLAQEYQLSGKIEGSIDAYLETLSKLIGFIPEGAPKSEEAAKPEEPEQQDRPDDTASDGITEVQDMSLLKDFITESLEYIDEIEVNILNLEQDPENKEYINAIFRPFHSIKGVAGFLNLDEIRTLAHSLENLLDKARNGELEVSSAVIDVVLEGADTLKAMIVHLKNEMEGRQLPPPSLDVTGLKERITQVESGVEPPPQRKRVGEILVDDGVISQADLNEGLQAAQDIPPKKIGEALISKGVATPKQVSTALRKQTEQATDATMIRVDMRKLDDMIDMVGELVITQTIIQQDVKDHISSDRNLHRDISQLSRISSSLQRASTGLRMIPIKQTFQRMSRLVRDLAKGAGKSVVIEPVGEDTEIDRNMVDEIYNPLVHLVRNAVDHGIDTPEERIRSGKPDKGLIELKAYHRGGNIVIEISDDGRGLNKDKILQKAIKNGVVNENDNLTDYEIYRLILLPGLSTAEQVTDISGRGVGMDVVKQAVEKLRGKIDITSIPGKGTTFITSFPLTMAIIDGMIVRVGKERYILPTTAIRQALRPTRKDYTHIIGKGEMITVMGRLLPLIRLADLFGIAANNHEPWDAITVVVEGEGRAKCIMVDEILGKAEVVIKSLGDGLKNTKGISGGAILGDGQIGLIIDPEGLFELSENL
ncbi:MAG TPA: chemotaxis protein CheA [Syntrophus sp. (in: bacteria)]|jgi:two-component system chemotaxis sensor kinase CheA|nr:chemotaxis protein CheA [Syntrophus sp. (in: bacteria)]